MPARRMGSETYRPKERRRGVGGREADRLKRRVRQVPQRWRVGWCELLPQWTMTTAR